MSYFFSVYVTILKFHQKVTLNRTFCILQGVKNVFRKIPQILQNISYKILILSPLKIALFFIQICTYLQYDSPFSFGTQIPAFLQGDGEHDMNPEKNSKKNK